MIEEEKRKLAKQIPGSKGNVSSDSNEDDKHAPKAHEHSVYGSRSGKSRGKGSRKRERGSVKPIIAKDTSAAGKSKAPKALKAKPPKVARAKKAQIIPKKPKTL
jgi:hypothetical protein